MRFQRRRISLKSTERKKPPPHGCHVFLMDQIFENNFPKGHTTTNLIKLFQILTSGFGRRRFFKNLFMSILCKTSPPHPPMAAMFFNGSKFRRIFEKGHPRNNPVRLFQYLTSGFRGQEFRRISLKSTQ